MSALSFFFSASFLFPPSAFSDPASDSKLRSPFDAARYHSLVIEEETFPEDQLEVLGWTEDKTIMAVQHKDMKHIQGVQFHPESIITDDGMKIVKNFVDSL